MITRIDLKEFKCFHALNLPLQSLTLLTGTNASGKSTVLQSLALLHQTMREHEWSSRLMLNGSVVRLGTVAAVVDRVHGSEDFGITLFDDDTSWFDWTFKGDRGAMSAAVKHTRGSTLEYGNWEIDEEAELESLRYLLPQSLSFADDALPLRLRRLTYLTAERIGPREVYLYDDPQLTPVVGTHGEYAVSILHNKKDDRISDRLVHREVPPTMLHQVEFRMGEFFPRCVLALDRVPHTNSLTLGIRTHKDSEYSRPIHAGFGLTQILPIIVAALASRENDLLLIENPEVHLHPAGEAQMGMFLASVASSGVQVLLETHSDHVLNGIRRAVKCGNLSHEEVAINFFTSRDDELTNGSPQVHSPAIDENGNIDNWPEGFFDQYDTDMNFFAGWH